MSRVNPYYNPKWEEIYNLHEEQRDHCEKRSDELAMILSQSEKDKADYQSTRECFDFHHKICLYCLETMQHPTIDAFWDWAKAFLGKDSLTSADGREVYSSEEFETFAQAKSFVENYVRMRNSSAAKIAA